MDERERHIMNRGRGEGWVILQIVLLAAMVVIPPRIGGLPAWPDALYGLSVVAGLIIGLIGLLFVGLSTLNLGANLTIFPHPKETGTLTQHGLYGLVRHPIYAGVLMGALGWSLLRASLPALALTVILGLFFDRKAAQEEIWLAEKYPDYADYRRRVRKLIPWLY
jgi:protein-S-isoprenylcysteine O-methyltransferase Ste14